MANNENEVASDFYDIDSLLSRSTKVACTYSGNTPKEVYDLLGTSAPQYTDEKGYKVLTPLWFVRALEPFCSLSLPMAYNSNVRNVMMANAAHADLEALQPYYYEMGMHLCHSVTEGISIALAECLLETMVQRIGGIVLGMFRDNETPRKIDNLEKKLYEEGLKCRNRLHEYLRTQQANKSRKRRLERL